jgi:hypothetical protein
MIHAFFDIIDEPGFIFHFTYSPGILMPYRIDSTAPFLQNNGTLIISLVGSGSKTIRKTVLFRCSDLFGGTVLVTAIPWKNRSIDACVQQKTSG